MEVSGGLTRKQVIDLRRQGIWVETLVVRHLEAVTDEEEDRACDLGE